MKAAQYKLEEAGDEIPTAGPQMDLVSPDYRAGRLLMQCAVSPNRERSLKRPQLVGFVQACADKVCREMSVTISFQLFYCQPFRGY